MEVDALYSLMEGEEVVLEVKIANPRKLGGALAAGNALGALFREMVRKGKNKNLSLDSVLVITNKRVIVASCSSNSVCCWGKESRTVWTWTRAAFKVVQADYEKSRKKCCCSDLASFFATIVLENGDGIEFDLVGCDDAKALALLGVIAQCAS